MNIIIIIIIIIIVARSSGKLFNLYYGFAFVCCVF